MPEKSREILDAFARLQLEAPNEAETRLKLINRVLFEVLEWTLYDVKVENRVSEDGKTEFADYTISTGFGSFLIEAKKLGRAKLEVTTRRKEILSRRLVTGETGDAITQARDYCRKLGIPFAVVTNGDQWIIFPASRVDGVTFEKSSAIIFDSLESAIGTNLEDFFGILSRPAVISGSLEQELLGRKENQINERRLNQRFDRPFSKVQRTKIFHLIENEIEIAFAEDIIPSDINLFKKAYVKTPDRIRYDSKIRMYIERTKSPTPDAPIKALSKYGQSRVSEVVKQAAERVRPLALLVLGSVGSGKSTFVHHIKVENSSSFFKKNHEKPYPHWIYIDFRIFGSSENVPEFIAKELFNYISKDEFLSDYEKCLKHAYKEEIAALKRGPLAPLISDEREQNNQIAALIKSDYEKKLPFVEKILGYATRNVAVFVAIDNVDQFEKPETQHEIFSNAIAMSRRIGFNLILPMRDSTFVKSHTTATFDAFDYDPIQVEPPDVISVLSKRFLIAKELLKGKPASFEAENGARVHLDDSSLIADLITESVLNTEVGNAISVLSTGDVRLALRMTREFLRNGYTATGKAIDIYQRTGQYRLPPHEAMRAIMIGSRSVYFEDYSPIANPFDAKLSFSSAQLMRLFLLNAIVSRFSSKSAEPLMGEEIRSNFLEIGFSPDITIAILRDLCRARFIFTASHGAPDFNSSYIPSRLGGYVVRSLLSNFVFLENTLMDTFIENDQKWSELVSLTEQIYRKQKITEKLEIRIQRVSIFFEYMTALYSNIAHEAARRGLSSQWIGNPLEDVRGEFERGIARIRQSAQRNYGVE